MVIFSGNNIEAFRDPAAYFFGGEYHLFFTKTIKENGYIYNFVAHSKSLDLLHWSEPRILTEKDKTKNYCSPGSIIKYKDEYIICVTSYPLKKPFAEESIADDTARLFLMRTKDFKNFSEPELVYAKGDVKNDDAGRMIDPFLLKDKDDDGKYLLFFKQNGVSMSYSRDLVNWTFCGSAEGGENACVLVKDNKYILLHSPENGIGIKESEDLSCWSDKGTLYLNQNEWDWANGRLTAAFAMEARGGTKYRYVLFFHGSRLECPPEIHGAASLAIAFTDDFKKFYYEP